MIRRAARAKINLYLHVLGKRPDGFHELDTLFQEIDLADELEYEPGGSLALVVEGAEVGPLEQNLVWRAALAFFGAAGFQAEGRFRLIKRIPAGAGLGGGSSDAATTLLILNEYYGQLLEPTKLADLALALGSDVPFFLKGGCQRGQGRGELLLPATAPAGPRTGYLLLPGISLATPAVFGAYANGARSDGDNHLLAAACAVSPSFAAVWAKLGAWFSEGYLFMTGSGSTCVWLGEGELAEATRALLAAASIGWQRFRFVGS